MPEQVEDVIIQDDLENSSQHIKSNKCKKILKLFWNIKKENGKNHVLENGCEKKDKKEKKKKMWDMEERKEVFKKNMENNWTDLPNTLQRKKEKICQDILSEYHHDSDSNDSENAKITSFSNFGKKSKENSYDLMNEKDEPTCEYFRQKKEDELDSTSLYNAKVCEKYTSKPEKFLNYKRKKNFTSEITFKRTDEETQISLERIRKLNEDEYNFEGKPENENLVRKQDSNDLKAAVDEINLLFHDLIPENEEQNDISASSDSGNSEPDILPSVNQEISTTSKNLNLTKVTEAELVRTRSNSSDSLLNGSSASISSVSENGQEIEKTKEIGCDAQSENESSVFEQNAEVTYVRELNDAKQKKCDETTEDIKESSDEKQNIHPKTRTIEVPKIQSDSNNNETTQYSDLIFPSPSKTQGLFVNEQFKGEININHPKEENQDLKQAERKIIYQELQFDNKKKLNEKENNEDEDSYVKVMENQYSDSIVINSICEEQKAKKKSAEAIAKELSSQVFLKKNQGFNKENVITISIKNDYKTETLSNDSEAEKKSKEEEENLKVDYITRKNSKLKEEEEENWDFKGKPEFGVGLEYFSVADWRKAVALGAKRGITSAVMETIVEEPETDTATKLTVREILRRFEELGNKHFSDKVSMTDDERTATLKQIHQTLKCLEEKVKNFEIWSENNLQHEQYHENIRHSDQSLGGWTGRGATQRPIHSAPLRGHDDNEEIAQTTVNDGKHSLLQFAIHHFRQSPEKFEMLKASDGSISGSLKVIESKNKKNKEKGKGGNKDSSEWTWKEQVDLVKFTAKPIEQSLLQLDPELSDLAVECFLCLMRYMGDLPMPTDVSEVKCVYTILMHCHKYEQLRDEVYCQLMKQTTNNKSIQQESCQRGWRLFSIVAAYFSASDTLKPFLFKYLETAAYDKRRAYHGTAMVCLQNLRKTYKYGGRKNVPSVEEITAISAGRNSKRQIYRLPGGTEKVVNTKSTTVVQDVIEELCVMINVVNPQEMEEFSVYCIVEGDTFTMPLAREEYILDVTTELHKNHQVFYLIFCRSVWYFPLRLDSQLYVEVVFNQIAPDYLEGLLLILPGESLEQDIIYDISKIAALLHRAADMTEVPTMKETKFLLPKPALGVRDVKPSQWVNMVQSNWQDCENLTTIQAKAQVLDALSKWPLFGSSFFAVKKVSEPKDRVDHILALNRNGVHFIDLITHETLLHYPFSEVISTRKVKSEDGTLFLDMKCGNLMQQRITRLQTDQAHEISRLIRQYITMQQRMGANQM